MFTVEDYGFYIPKEHIDKVSEDYKSQLNVLQICEEECSELIKAISKYVRVSQGTTDISKEEAISMMIEGLTHVEICIRMLRNLFDISQVEIDDVVNKKR